MIKVNGRLIETGLFPNGELLVHTDVLNEVIESNSDTESFRVDFRYQFNDDLVSLYLILSHIKFMKNTDKNQNIILNIYYMPYSRMDRNQNGNCFSLKHISVLLSSIIDDNDIVNILEPHSDVTLDNVKNSIRVDVITPLMNKILAENPDIDVICYPDKGAKTRFQNNYVQKPVVYCEKLRDFDTGEIIGLDLVNPSEIDLKGKNILILDDLCSKGGTFYYTSKKLKEHGVKDIYLGVCHMETNIRYGQLLNYSENNSSLIKHIYCLDTMISGIESELMLDKYTNLTIYNTEMFLTKHNLTQYCYNVVM